MKNFFLIKNARTKKLKKMSLKKCADAQFFQTPIGNFSETNAPPTNAFQIPPKNNNKNPVFFRTGNPDIFF